MKVMWRIIATLLAIIMIEFVIEHDPWRAFGASLCLLIWIILKDEVQQSLS